MKGEMNVTIIIGYVIVPIVLIIMGIIQTKYPPRDINSFLGFRTKKASRSQRNWDIAQKLCGKYLVISGVISAISFITVLIIKKIVGFDDVILEYIFILPALLVILSIIPISNKLPD